MELHCATSDVKNTGEVSQSPLRTGLISDAPPEVQKSSLAENSRTGVSTNYTPMETTEPVADNKKRIPHWYALRTTYGREKKAYDYLISKNIEAFYPTIKSVKLVDGKRITIEESRIPNIFFARGTEEEIKSFVYDNVNLPFLRFYYSRKHIDNKMANVPLVVPDSQMSTLKIICSAESDDIVATTEAIERFKKGQKVLITEGMFAGVTGIVARHKSQQRVGIIIEGLLTICTAYVPSAFLQKIE